MNLPLLDSPLLQLLAQSSGNASSTQKAAALGFGIVALLAILVAALVVFALFGFCFKRICEKIGTEPGILVWIPIAQLVPLLEAARQPIWFIVLFFIPVVNVAVAIFLFWKLCEARGKAGPLALLMLVPLGFPGLCLYLAFAD
jgi:hypothetical protein